MQTRKEETGSWAPVKKEVEVAKKVWLEHCRRPASFRKSVDTDTMYRVAQGNIGGRLKLSYDEANPEDISVHEFELLRLLFIAISF